MMYVQVNGEPELEQEEQISATKLCLQSKECRLLRWTIRAFGLWHPVQACFAEKWIYPAFIHALFVMELIFQIYFMAKALSLIGNGTTNDLILELSLRLSTAVCFWLGHAFTVKYFKSRDFEQNVINITCDSRVHVQFKSTKRRLNVLMAFSIFLTLLITSLTIKTGSFDNYPVVWSSTATNETASQKLNNLIHNMNLFDDPFNLYEVPVSLSLTWIVFMLYETSQIRLSKLRDEFLAWEQSAEDAIFRHVSYYSTSIHSTSSEIKFLFISHNIMMVIAAPLLFYLCVEMGRNKGMTELIIFIAYFLWAIFIWIMPLYFAERISSNEDMFRDEVNNYCKGYMNMKIDNDQPDLDNNGKTFASRKEVQKLVSYLKERIPGLVIGGYAFQLKLSMFSLYLGLIVFAIKILS